MADEPTEQSRRHRSRDEPTDAARPHRSNRHRQSVQEAESYIERLASEKSLEMHLYPEQHNNTELLPVFQPARDESNCFEQSYFEGALPWQCVFVFAFTLLSHAYATRGPAVGPNLAQSSLVTLAAGAAIHLVAPAAFGSYAGMIAKEMAPTWWWVTLHALFAVGGWLVLQKYKLLNGVGGRLGSMTFVTGNLATLVSVAAGAVDLRELRFRDWNGIYTRDQVVTVLAAALLSSTITRWANARPLSGYLRNPVAAGGMTAFLLMIVVSVSGYIHSKNANSGIGVGSFVGMAAVTLLPRFGDVACAALLGAGYFLLFYPFELHPPGGKQGSCAALGAGTWMLFRFVGRSAARRAALAFPARFADAKT